MAYIGRTPTNAALTASDLADGIVTTAKIDADAVTDAKIADDVVGTEHLTANEVDTAALGADAVTGAQLADNAVNSEHYTDGSIDTAHIGADQITNAKIADDQIDSEHYVDGSIDTAHIADNQITLAKLAGGTDGNIISYDASGDPVAIATGNDGQVLTSAGAGAPPAFEDAGGGEWTKLLHTTADDDGQVIFNSTYITSTYQDYKIVWSNVHTTNDNQNFTMSVSTDNGSNAINIDSAVKLYKDDGTNSFRSETNDAVMRLHGNETSGNDATISQAGVIEMFAPSATDTRTHFLGRSISNIGDSAFASFHSLLGGSTLAATAVNHIKFHWLAGNIVTGEFTLYGRKI